MPAAPSTGGIYVAQGAITLPGMAAASNTVGGGSAMTSGEPEPAPAGGENSGGGFWNWLGSWFSGPTEKPPVAPPEDSIPLEEFDALLDKMKAAGKQVTVGTMPGRQRETIGQRFGNVYQTIAVDFPIYFGGQLLDAGTSILINSAAEFVAFQIAAKARGFIVIGGKKGGKLVLNVVAKEGENATAGGFQSFVQQWNEARASGNVIGHNPRNSGRPIAPSNQYKLDMHGAMPSPRPGQQSHQGAMSASMKARFPDYDPNLAPAILMPGANHQATFGVYDKWRAAMKKKMGGTFDWSKVSEQEMRALSEQMFDAANVPQNLRRGYWAWFERMLRALTP